MSRRYRVVISSNAIEELNSIVQYVTGKSPTNARRLNGKLLDAMRSLDFMPERFRRLPELETLNAVDVMWREMIVDRYRILYAIKPNSVHILSVFDGRRNSLRLIDALLSKHSANDG